jgi:glycosyltransferase involved in cell wall biosynthesis
MSVVIASGGPFSATSCGKPSLVASVVVAVQGNTGDLPGLVAALNDQTLAPSMFELVVVDNHRSVAVESSAFAAAGFGWRLVHEPVPGLSRARNTGIRAAAGGCVLITDADSRPDSSWVQMLTTALLQEDAFVAGGPAIPRVPVKATLRSGLLQWFVPPAWPETTRELGPPYWIVGCNMGFRRTDPPWMFDEELGVVGRRRSSCEDLEFVIRAQTAGLHVLLVPAAIVHRAVTADDLRLRALLGRAFWHGVSVARLRRKVPARYILDTYRIRDVITEGDLLTRLTHLARIAGYHGGRLAAPLRRADPERS